MAFELIGSSYVRQTGVDTDLSGLASIAGVTTATVLERTVYTLPAGRGLQVNGTLSFNARLEKVICSIALSGGVNISNGGTLNIEGRFHEDIGTSSELVANDYDGAVMTNALAFEIYGGDNQVGGTFFNGKAITVLGTLNAKGVSLYDGYGGLYITTPATGILEDFQWRQLPGQARDIDGNLIAGSSIPADKIRRSTCDAPGFIARRGTIFNGCIEVGPNLISDTDDDPFQWTDIRFENGISTEGGFLINGAPNDIILRDVSSANQLVDVAYSSSLATNDQTEVVITNAENGTASIIKPPTGDTSPFGYVNIGKEINTDAPAGARIYIEDSPSDIASTNTRTGENAKIVYTDEVKADGTLLLGNIRVVTGIIDTTSGTETAYDTGTTRIDRRGNAATNVSTSDEKKEDKFDILFYKADRIPFMLEDFPLKGNDIKILAPAMLPDIWYDSDISYVNDLVNLDGFYKSIKDRKQFSSLEFLNPTPQTLFGTIEAGVMNIGTRNLGRFAETESGFRFVYEDTQNNLFVKDQLSSGVIKGLKTTGTISLNAFKDDILLSLEAKNYVHVRDFIGINLQGQLSVPDNAVVNARVGGDVSYSNNVTFGTNAVVTNLPTTGVGSYTLTGANIFFVEKAHTAGSHIAVEDSWYWSTTSTDNTKLTPTAWSDLVTVDWKQCNSCRS